jgi:hypothetical protein
LSADKQINGRPSSAALGLSRRILNRMLADQNGNCPKPAAMRHAAPRQHFGPSRNELIA